MTVHCPAISRQRVKKWAPKTRSGCDTCRKRHVKCDEARPVCHACTRLKRTCLYSKASKSYDETMGIDRSQVIQVGREMSSSSLSCEEALHLDIYCKAIAPWLSTYAQAYFFVDVLPRLSIQHQAIKHALVAVAMAGGEFYLGRHVRRHRQIWHYDQALKHMYASKASTDVVMLACVVLWLHDNIIEDTRAAVLHVKGFVRMLLAYEQKRTPTGVGKNLDCTIWRGLSHWGQRTQPHLDTRLDLNVIPTVRQKLKDPHLGRLNPDSSTADALLFVTSVTWACDKHSADMDESLTITFEELRSFLDTWYATKLNEVESNSDDHTILECHYTVMSLVIRAQERSNSGYSGLLVDDPEGLYVFEDMLTSLESLSVEARTQRAGKKDLVLPLIPVALEAERMAPSRQHKLRIEALLRSVRRVDSFWSTSVAAGILNESIVK